MWWTVDQLRQVEHAVEAAAAGTPTVLSIGGDPGQGKTSLLSEVLARAADFGVLRGDGDPRPQAQPYGLLDQWADADSVEALEWWCVGPSGTGCRWSLPRVRCTRRCIRAGAGCCSRSRPLYPRALLAEHGPEELSTPRVLPAPTT